MIDDLLLDAALVDLRHLSTEQQKNKCRLGSWKWSQNLERRPVLAFDGFGKSHHGLCVIPNALDETTQLLFAHACLTEFVELPHLTSMHRQNHQFSGIWKKACKSFPQNPSEFPLLAKLSWSALGYHYDWNARDKHSPVPESLQQLGKKCAAACGMKLAAEAIIINFYKTKSAMGGHLDDAEYTMDHPVISLSLGSSCIFVIGGQSKDEPPLQILLRSGDIVVMGKVSRRCYRCSRIPDSL
ncbi:hypothetical protein CCR75_009173 [Bremia lactucae]|uniref:Alpha-ketoglutarate-dependent dioxygenase AlkB-like domain-containing protein n=1 Tax=Bremia lactucae TaxID=4779 RepID=A0A976IEE7_BRELC|nr:hypothetical protein CCR75_009173 [Bremia lactucae]